MQEAELKKLLKLTAIELEPDQMPAFLDYFSSMKKMFDEFYDTPFGTVPRTSYEEGGEGDFVDGGNKTSPTPPYEGGKWEEKGILCFTEGEVFAHTEAILANVDKKRLVGNAIEVKSAFGE